MIILEKIKKILSASKTLFLSTLDFLNLLDSNKRLSITNSHIWIMTALFVYSQLHGTAPEAAWAVIAGLAATLVNYSHKRFTTHKEKKDDHKSQADRVLEENKKIAASYKELAEKHQKLLNKVELAKAAPKNRNSDIWNTIKE